jgi:hypothetical protein
MRRSPLVLTVAAAAAALSLSLLAGGCTEMNGSTAATAKPVDLEPRHPEVVIQGIDGTLMAGQLLNGSVTMDSGQGELTLLTDHVHSITMAQDSDRLDSDSMKVTGRLKDQRFMLKNEHGVFTLNKERLRKIDFILNPATPTNVNPATAPGQTMRANAAPPALGAR